MQSTIANTENAVQQNLSLGNRSVLKEIYTTNDGGAQVRQSINQLPARLTWSRRNDRDRTGAIFARKAGK